MRLPALILISCLIAAPVWGQTPRASKSAAEHARNIAGTCPGDWAQETCLRHVSGSAFDMVVDYANKLDNAGKSSMLETLKQECAAATVSSEENIPAYAYQSAYTVCANTIYDISEETGVSPDQARYQLLVGAVLCLSKDPRCTTLEQQMKAVR